ncbi:MAG: hypothetical protein IT233_13285 [Bacteroidia bacterium]|nr:hypothetical protein [Bacteroidia bacterium]
MKTPTIILALLLSCTFALAQNIDYAGVSVQYTKLPLKPLDKTVKNYQAQVSMEYLQTIELKKLEYKKKLAQADSVYAFQQKQYDEQLKTAALKFQMEMTAWNKLTPQQQAVTPKPQMPLIEQPVKQVPMEEKYEKTYNTELLASTHLNLEGFNRLPDNSVKIWVGLMGFENEEPRLSTRTEQQKKDNQTISITKYFYTFNYRHQMKLKVSLPNGSVVKEELFAPTLVYRPYNTQEFNSQQEAEAWWILNKDAEIQRSQERIVNENLKQINDQLNDDHGYRKTSRGFSVIWVNEKKNYQDFRDALTYAKNAYAIIGNPGSFQNATEELLKAIELWEKALTESNTSSRKARVNEAVTELLLLNLAEAYAWLNNFDKAQQYHSQVMTYKLNAKKKSAAASVSAFIGEQRKRAEANK